MPLKLLLFGGKVWDKKDWLTYASENFFSFLDFFRILLLWLFVWLLHFKLLFLRNLKYISPPHPTPFGGVFHIVDIHFVFCPYLRSDPSFNRSILTLLYLKFGTYAHQLFITTYYLQISWHDMNLKLTLRIRFAKWSWSMILLTWSRNIVLLPPKVSFMVCLNVDISTRLKTL